jgi:WD40 repeat protein
MKTLTPFLFALSSCLIQAAEPPTEPTLRIEGIMHTIDVSEAVPNASEQVVLTSSNDKTARIWELSTGRLLRVLRPPIDNVSEGKLYTGAISPDGTLAAVGGWTGLDWDGKGLVYLFDTRSGNLLRRFGGEPDTFYDEETGLPIRRLGGFLNVVQAVSFSPSGRYVAALSDGHRREEGLRVWEVSTGEELALDFGEFRIDAYYGGSGTSLDWRDDRHLVTTAEDWRVRLYEIDSRERVLLTHMTILPGGFNADTIIDLANQQTKSEGPLITKLPKTPQPQSVRFSPDGKKIAVGYSNAQQVMVASGFDLSFLFAAEMPTESSGNLSQVAWSKDGTTLWAGGTLHRGGDRTMYLRRWADGGEGTPTDVVLTGITNGIMSIQPLREGRVLFGSTLPAWGVLDGVRRDPITQDFRDVENNFYVSRDAHEIAYREADKNQPLFRFSIPNRQLSFSEDLSVPPGLKPPRTEGSKVTNWRGGAPKLNGEYLMNVVLGYDPSHSLAVAPDSASFVLGCRYTLQSFSQKGKTRWGDGITTPGNTWKVNVAEDGRTVVAAYADGTIRWHRYKDGRELLALFLDAKKNRWILWTPEGYYDASPGAEDLIGWHVNRGKDRAADFFPASRFRAVYYRPDVIQRVLKTLNTTEALREANAGLGRVAADAESIRAVIARLSPPVVELASGGVLGEVKASKDARSISVRYRVRQTGGEAPVKVSVRFNGRPVDIDAPLPPDGKEAEVEIPLPGGVEGEVTIIAEHKFGTSEAAILRVRRESGSPPVRKPDLYVIACGVAHLQANEALQDGTLTSGRKRGVRKDAEGRLSFDDLLFAGDDARKFAGLFGGQEGKAYAHVIPTILVDKQATTVAITDALDDVKRKARPGDVVVVFFSGHGHFIPDPGFLLITHDTNPQNLAGTALTGQELARRLAEIRGSVVLALDTCYSGAALEGDKRVHAVTGPGDLTGFVNQLSSSEQGVVVISSSAENQSSFEDDEEKQGVFTKAMAEGFAGGALQNGQITCASLQKWVIERVPILTRRIDPKAEQYPACIMPKGVPDFVLATP